MAIAVEVYLNDQGATYVEGWGFDFMPNYQKNQKIQIDVKNDDPSEWSVENMSKKYIIRDVFHSARKRYFKDPLTVKDYHTVELIVEEINEENNV
jgi:hypothetical protein